MCYKKIEGTIKRPFNLYSQCLYFVSIFHFISGSALLLADKDRDWVMLSELNSVLCVSMVSSSVTVIFTYFLTGMRNT